MIILKTYYIISSLSIIYEENKILIPENLTNEKDETIKDYLDELELIKIDDISKATKKYLMRYCLGDYDKKENILKNMKIEKMFFKKDIWEEKIYFNPKFKEEYEKIIKLNNDNDNYLDKYFLYNIINDNEREEESSNTPNEISNEEMEEEKELNDGNNDDKIENSNMIESSENKNEEKIEENYDGFNYDFEEDNKSENSRDMDESS